MTIHHILAARHFSPRQPDLGAGSSRILIRDLVLDCSIGVYEHEKQQRQRVRFNVEIEVRADPPRSDEIGAVLSYEKIVKEVKSLAAGTHINLVETLAEQVAGLCLADRRARLARVRVEKLDIEPAAESVGVEIERHQAPAFLVLASEQATQSGDQVVQSLTTAKSQRQASKNQT